MYADVPALVLWSWGGAAVVLAVMAGHRFRLFLSGRRDRVNRYVTTTVLLAIAFIATRYPSPLRYYLDRAAPRESLFLNYSLVIWIVYMVLHIAGEVYARPRWHGWVALALAAVVQLGAALAFSRARLVEPFSLSAEARAGDVGALLYLLQMIVFCSLCALYLALLLLRLAWQTQDREVRFGQATTAIGLLILVLAALEEVLFLTLPLFSMAVHGVLISVLVALGIWAFSAGIFLFSPLGQKLTCLLVDAGRYARLRPLGWAIARTWPEVCLENYAWWTVLDLFHVRRRLYRVMIEWMDLRRLLAAYLPDAVIPCGADPELEVEADYLARGLQRWALRPREKSGDPACLTPLPGGLEEAGRFLLRVERARRRLGPAGAGKCDPG